MSTSSRYLAFFAYLLSIPGALFVLLARRDDPFAVFHARQSLAIAVAAVGAPLIWAVIAWAGAWLPVGGPLIGLSLFSLVIATYLVLVVGWVAGMVFALRGEVRLVPLVGAWTVPRVRRKSLPELEENAHPELIEATTPEA
ncbi:MAG: hypothetical protein H0X37_12220 [Herpetosiphonaceae bacterium]|nr:hypothetical protein [Herpetosiphonaceae bacterium]